MTRLLNIRIIIFILLLIWCAGFSNTLFLSKPETALAGTFLNIFYSHVCHQDAGKVITTESGHFLVCARCMGIYSGAFLFSLISLFAGKIKVGFFFPALVLMFLDILSVNLKIYSYNKLLSLITGLLFGMTLFPYILYTLENSLSKDEIK